MIGEAPGQEESVQGEPFVGGAGQWLDGMLQKAGIKRDDVTLVNCIQCRPQDNIFPTDSDARVYISAQDAEKAVQHCFKNHVEPLLKSRNWTRIDLLGAKPLEIVGGKEGGIHKWRGSPIPIPCLDPQTPKAIPTLHPAFIARDQKLMPVVVNDLRKGLQVPPERYTLFPDLAQVKAFTATSFAYDIETPFEGEAWEKKEIKMVGLSAKPCEAMVVPFRGAYIDELKRIFGNAKEVIGHNSVSFDSEALAKFGVTIPKDCKHYDTLLMHHLRFPDLGGEEASSGAGHDLGFVASQLIQKPAWKDDKAILELYCARDTDATIQIFQILKQLCEQAGLMDLYFNIQIPLSKICLQMTKTGIKIDPSQIGRVREKLLAELERLEQDLPPEMRTYLVPKRTRLVAPAGTVNAKGKPVKYLYTEGTKKIVPWRSTPQKQAFLYGTEEPWQLGLPVQKDAKTDRITTGKTALDKLKKKVKDPKPLVALKRLNQLDETLTTFCKEGMLAGPGRMHTHFKVAGTSSGRLSSADPNLQNIPDSARVIYVPSEEGMELAECDYSGIENRLTAYFAGDTERLKRLETIDGFSEHKYLASIITGIPYNEVEKDNDKDAPYGKAKRIVHGSNYGMGAMKIVKLYDMDFKETKQILAAWKKEIWPTIEWQERCAKEAIKQGYLVTPFQRRRWFWTSSAYTESLSFLPQSTAADVIFRAMIGLMYDRIGMAKEEAERIVGYVEALPQPARLLLQVHDALIFEYPKEIRNQVLGVVRRVMEQPWNELGGMTLPIGIAVGPSWGEVESYKLEAA